MNPEARRNAANTTPLRPLSWRSTAVEPRGGTWTLRPHSSPSPVHDAVVFDLDGVVTQTSIVHAAAWKALFDAYLRTRAAHEGREFRPFDERTDYRLYVDGKPRYDGVRDFLASRGIELPMGPTVRPARRRDRLRPRQPQERVLQRRGGGARHQDVPRRRSRSSSACARPGVHVGLMSSSKNTAMILAVAGLTDLFDGPH